MSNEILKVHTLDGQVLELPRTSCWLVDRSRIVQGQGCTYKRWLSTEAGPSGKGVVSRYTSDDLALGTAVHAGLEWLMNRAMEADQQAISIEWGDETIKAAEAAKASMLASYAQGLEDAGDGAYMTLVPELAELIATEQAELAYALVWIFAQLRLPQMLEQYEVLAVEPEICWLVGIVGGRMIEPAELTKESGFTAYDREPLKYIVMMSRPDAILRDRNTGALWVVSWKTTKRFTDESTDKLAIDVQSWSECLAVQALYNQTPAGTFYGYFIKSDRLWSREDGCKRYNSGLIRPYTNYMGIGEMAAHNFRFVGEWFDVEAQKTSKIGKGWSRCNIWERMPMDEWLTLVASGDIHPEAQRNWLDEAVAQPLPQPFDPQLASRWLAETLSREGQWADVSVVLEHETGNCFVWGKKCYAYRHCWENLSIDEALGNGQWQIRTPNHPAEET